jgi:hypothetical protein
LEAAEYPLVPLALTAATVNRCGWPLTRAAHPVSNKLGVVLLLTTAPSRYILMV